MIVCTKCGIEKPSSEFSRDKQKKNGLYSCCKSCKAKYDKIYRKRPEVRERTAKYMKEYNQRPGSKKKKIEYQKKYCKKNKKRIAEYSKRYNLINKEKVAKRRKNTRQTPEAKRANLSSSLLRKYGITIKERNRMITKQGGKCLICGRILNDKNTHIDHDHKTGKVRGVLCGFCNRGLGCFFDNSIFMRNAASYIEYHQGIGVGRSQKCDKIKTEETA